jgi:hypothetical protein
VKGNATVVFRDLGIAPFGLAEQSQHRFLLGRYRTGRFRRSLFGRDRLRRSLAPRLGRMTVFDAELFVASGFADGSSGFCFTQVELKGHAAKLSEFFLTLNASIRPVFCSRNSSAGW